MAIHFFTDNYPFNLKNKRILKRLILEVIHSHNCRLGDINYIFTDENTIVEINKSYLDHLYPTDIITFPLGDYPTISADIYICIPVINDNALTYNVSFLNELHRVIMHGVLHLMGYNDSTDEEIIKMRAAEDLWLDHLSKMLNA